MLKLRVICIALSARAPIVAGVRNKVALSSAPAGSTEAEKADILARADKERFEQEGREVHILEDVAKAEHHQHEGEAESRATSLAGTVAGDFFAALHLRSGEAESRAGSLDGSVSGKRTASSVDNRTASGNGLLLEGLQVPTQSVAREALPEQVGSFVGANASVAVQEFCLPGSDGAYDGCKSNCKCLWYQQCYKKAGAGTCSISVYIQVMSCYFIFASMVGCLMTARRRLQWEVDTEEEANALRAIETIKNRRKFIASLSNAELKAPEQVL